MLTRTSLAGVCSDPSKTEKKTFPYVEITSGQTTRADIPGHEHRDFDVDVYGLYDIERGDRARIPFGAVSLPGDAAVQEQAEPVVGEVAESEADPFDAFDQQVDRLGGAGSWSCQAAMVRPSRCSSGTSGIAQAQ